MIRIALMICLMCQVIVSQTRVVLTAYPQREAETKWVATITPNGVDHKMVLKVMLRSRDKNGVNNFKFTVVDEGVREVKFTLPIDDKAISAELLEIKGGG